jgi:hypothetical protein
MADRSSEGTRDRICEAYGNGDNWWETLKQVIIMTAFQNTNHRFAIGTMVHLHRVGPLRNAVPGPYEVLETLPERDGELQYRIKSAREPYQRVMGEGELERD